MNPFLTECRRLLAPALLLAAAGSALAADTLTPSVAAVRDDWAKAVYATPKPQRQAALEALSQRAASARDAQSQDADALIWDGIVLSSLAGERGGIGALGLVKQARKDFEQALAIDPTALDGAAYTSLGALYYQVPGWPIGFGNDDKARDYLLKGLQIDPDGIDANYFYGDFLRDQGDWKNADAALQKAKSAPPRAGRELADSGRRKEIDSALAEVRKHLAQP
ncbi:hypothetical protein CSC70_00665 [Pseudoxanthomonas kalamensis DSM 18571]|uniref:tetratricopeptide repeat protein n=1 Tax=Pseudoxanthomonas kalamensis TaxID=289483 RepID=UPI0013911163|nr:hypothetical protein [Pseudoxanthomonas kalamensis]KAF1712077.1 hypothetical protein CSC70_00665 [Pseudoxanthomonas kalamensis DSM 18571]